MNDVVHVVLPNIGSFYDCWCIVKHPFFGFDVDAVGAHGVVVIHCVLLSVFWPDVDLSIHEIVEFGFHGFIFCTHLSEKQTIFSLPR